MLHFESRSGPIGEKWQVGPRHLPGLPILKFDPVLIELHFYDTEYNLCIILNRIRASHIALLFYSLPYSTGDPLVLRGHVTRGLV